MTSTGGVITNYAPIALGGYYFDFGVANLQHLGSTPASAEAKALSKLYQKIREESYGTNGLLFLGELRETIHLLRNPFEAIRTGVQRYLSVLKSERAHIQSTLRKRRGESNQSFYQRKIDALVKAMAGSWLALQFGVKPLLSDVKEIAETAIDLLTEPGNRKRVRGKSPVTEYASSNDTYTGVYSWLNVRQTWSKRTECRVRYVAGLSHTLAGPDSGLRNAVSAYGFQWQNFIPTAYELLPWSFLIDYFVNAGAILEAACTDTSAVRWACRSETQETDISVKETYVPVKFAPAAYPTVASNGITGRNQSARTVRHLTVLRTRIEELPLPPIVVSIPGIDSDKWKNMAALLASARDFRFR
jgi:hypothetical protein